MLKKVDFRRDLLTIVYFVLLFAGLLFCEPVAFHAK